MNRTAACFAAFAALLLYLTPNTSLAQEKAKKDSSFVFDTIYLERVQVVGRPAWQTTIPGAATYISTEELRKQSYDDINRVLRSVSGINIQEEDGFGLRPNIGIRGAGVERSTKVNLMEDGVLISPAPYSAPAAYYFPMVGRMSAVEVRKGSSQIKYGPNSTGGAINLVSTPIPFEVSANGEVSLGENNANKFHGNVGATFGNFGFLIEGMNISDDGFKRLDNGGDTGFEITDLMAKLMVRTKDNASVYQRLEFKAGYYDEVSDETYLGLTRSDFDQSPFRRYAGSQVDQMTADHTQFMLRHFALFSERFNITTTAYRNDFSRNWYKLESVNSTDISTILRTPEQFTAEMDFLRGTNSPDDALTVRANNRTYFSTGIETILSFNNDWGRFTNDLEFGIRFHADEEDRFQLEDDFRMANGTMVLTTAGIAGTQANRIGSANALSFYIKDNLDFGQLTVSPGLRMENIWFENRNFGRNDVNRTGQNLSKSNLNITEWIPGVGATFAFNENITLISGIHKGFSPPGPSSSEGTESERSVNYELGGRFANPVTAIELIGFFNNYSNLLGSDLAAGGGGGTTSQFNAGDVDVFGLEFSLNTSLSGLFNLSNTKLPIQVSYTFTEATFQSSFESDFSPWGSVQKGDNIPFIPEHQFNASVGVNHKKISINASANTQSAMRTVAGSGSIPADVRTDAHFIMDAGASYQFTENIQLFSNIRNLFDEVYIVSDRPAGLRPGLPRTLIGGLRFNM